MSATNSDGSANWRSGDWDGDSEKRSGSGGKTREAIPASGLVPPEPQPTAAGCQGLRRNCAAMWEPAAGLCKRQQAESANPQNALKRRCSAMEEKEEEEEERRCRPHQRVPESESDRAFRRKVSASLHFFLCSFPPASLQHSVERNVSSNCELTGSHPVTRISHDPLSGEAFVSLS